MSSCELAYELSGPEDAPAVLLTPSLGTDRSMLDRQAARLAERFRVVSCDIRGHGGSPVPAGPYSIAELGGDLLALMDSLALEHASLFGVSIGAMTSIWVAAHAPGRVERLVVCCSSSRIDNPESYRERAAAVRSGGLEPIVDAALTRWFAPGFDDWAVLERFRRMLLSVAPEGYAGCCEAIAAMDLTAELGSIAAPTLVIAGAEDPATPPAHGRRIADGIAGASFELVPGASHLANVEAPAVVSELLFTHLAARQEEDQ